MQIAKDDFYVARESQRYFENKNRRERHSNPEVWVMLQDDRGYATSRAEMPQKWPPRIMGSEKVREKIGEVSFRVELPPSMP